MIVEIHASSGDGGAGGFGATNGGRVQRQRSKIDDSVVDVVDLVMFDDVVVVDCIDVVAVDLVVVDGIVDCIDVVAVDLVVVVDDVVVGIVVGIVVVGARHDGNV